MATATLQAIRDKVRRLTRSPSVNQLTDATLDEYVNTFIAYDFPETLRLFSLKKTLTFYTKPYVDTYTTNEIANDPLEDFTTNYITIEPPVYIAGKKAFYSQSREEFFNIFPQNTIQEQIGTGDGGTTVFSGTLQNIPVQRNNVIFTSINTANNSLVRKDVPFNQSSGNLVQPDNSAPATLDPVNQINYITGVFTVTFTSAPAANEPVYAQIFPLNVTTPTSVLYYANTFTFRPVPDGAYKVTFDAFVKPTELLSSDPADEPELTQWWQYIAYGASKKIFEDRMDMESVQMIMPEFNRQERMVLRRSIVQQTNERTATIYTEQANIGAGFDYWGSN